MQDFLYLVPIALALGLMGLVAFLWSLGSGQYDDLDGAAERILLDDLDRPGPDRPAGSGRAEGLAPGGAAACRLAEAAEQGKR